MGWHWHAYGSVSVSHICIFCTLCPSWHWFSAPCTSSEPPLWVLLLPSHLFSIFFMVTVYASTAVCARTCVGEGRVGTSVHMNDTCMEITRQPQIWFPGTFCFNRVGLELHDPVGQPVDFQFFCPSLLSILPSLWLQVPITECIFMGFWEFKL